MNALFPYDHVVVGLLILIVGFLFHWVGQLISVLNWELAIKLGLQEQEMPPEYNVYEQAIASADVAIAWTYGLAGAGLLLGAGWALKLAWIPGSILTYHALSAWFWTANQRKAGIRLMSQPMRVIWCLANLATGMLAMLLAWSG
ncbi:MAG: hypothetical protein KKB20_12170 [Proteobacteria bacterium]|nr:hypothetical protein [Pseudomonadota bacterium]